MRIRDTHCTAQVLDMCFDLCDQACRPIRVDASKVGRHADFDTDCAHSAGRTLTVSRANSCVGTEPPTSGRVGEDVSIPTPGHRRRSPAPGSHRTWRADFPHHALRQLIYSTASACMSRYGRRSFGRSNGVRCLMWWKAAQVRCSPAQLRLRSIRCQ